MLELDEDGDTDIAQYGFLDGVEVIKAALSLLASFQSTDSFLFVLDLANAYDVVLKKLLFTKIQKYCRLKLI